jgi:hypothetical protein
MHSGMTLTAGIYLGHGILSWADTSSPTRTPIAGAPDLVDCRVRIFPVCWFPPSWFRLQGVQEFLNKRGKWPTIRCLDVQSHCTLCHKIFASVNRTGPEHATVSRGANESSGGLGFKNPVRSKISD